MFLPQRLHRWFRVLHVADDHPVAARQELVCVRVANAPGAARDDHALGRGGLLLLHGEGGCGGTACRRTRHRNRSRAEQSTLRQSAAEQRRHRGNGHHRAAPPRGGF